MHSNFIIVTRKGFESYSKEEAFVGPHVLAASLFSKSVEVLFINLDIPIRSEIVPQTITNKFSNFYQWNIEGTNSYLLNENSV